MRRGKARLIQTAQLLGNVEVPQQRRRRPVPDARQAQGGVHDFARLLARRPRLRQPVNAILHGLFGSDSGPVRRDGLLARREGSRGDSRHASNL